MELTEYLIDTYNNFKKNRKELEIKWRKNKAAFDGSKTINDKNVGMGDTKNEAWQSDSVINTTRTKVLAGGILVNDVICSGGSLPFNLIELKNLPYGTPHSDIDIPDPGTVPPEYEHLSKKEILSFEKEKAKRELLNAIQQGSLSQEQAQEAFAEIEQMSLPEKEFSAAERMKKLIQDQMAKADALKATRQTVRSAAIYGEGIGKLYPYSYVNRGFERDESGYWDMRETKYNALAVKNISIFNFFTELEDADITSNLGVFERFYMSRSDIFNTYTADDQCVIASELDSLSAQKGDISEYSSANSVDDTDSPALGMVNRRRKTEEVLEFWGKAPLRAVVDFERENGIYSEESDGTYETEWKNIEITAVIAGGKIIRFARADNMPRPYFRMVWEEPVDDVSSKSIADIISTMQDSMNSTLRLFEDNKRLAANVMVGIKRRYLENHGRDIKPQAGKVIDIDEACDDVRKAIQPIVIPDIGENLRSALAMYETAASEQSMIPNISHGVSPSDKATAYEISLQNEKAGKYISDVVRNVDSGWIEPIVRFMYEWNMFDPNVTNECKGTFAVKALGFSSFNDKVVRMNKIKELLQMALSSELLGSILNVRELLLDYMRIDDNNPERFITSESDTVNLVDMKIQQFMNSVGQQMQQLQQQLADIVQAVPKLAEKSDSEIAVEYARAEKLKADAEKTLTGIDKMRGDIENNRMKAESGYAKTMAGVAKTIADADSVRVNTDKNALTPIPAPQVSQPQIDDVTPRGGWVTDNMYENRK